MPRKATVTVAFRKAARVPGSIPADHPDHHPKTTETLAFTAIEWSTPMSQTKTCRTCSTAKPVTEFYRYGGGKRGHRTRCKACDNIARRNGPSEATRIMREIVEHNHDPSFPLSPEAEAVVYTSAPLPPAVVAACERIKRQVEKDRLRRVRAFRKRYRQCPLMPIPSHLREAVA
jgi:hypothetical protein